MCLCQGRKNGKNKSLRLWVRDGEKGGKKSVSQCEVGRRGKKKKPKVASLDENVCELSKSCLMDC